MAATTNEDIKKQVKTHIAVGVALLATTAVAVAQAFLLDGSPILKLIIGLAIATFNAGLVAVIFMHLGADWRHRMIKISLLLAGVFFVALMLLSLLGKLDHVKTLFG
jgi:caa(3)-type oxidase subunit IV